MLLSFLLVTGYLLSAFMIYGFAYAESNDWRFAVFFGCFAGLIGPIGVFIVWGFLASKGWKWRESQMDSGMSVDQLTQDIEQEKLAHKFVNHKPEGWK